VLANRLTESGRHRVLLLEAGPSNRHPWLHIPLGYGKLFTNTRYNWCYSTEPQPECHGRNVIAPWHPVSAAIASISRIVASSPKRTTSTGSGNRPSAATNLLSSAMTTIRAIETRIRKDREEVLPIAEQAEDPRSCRDRKDHDAPSALQANAGMALERELIERHRVPRSRSIVSWSSCS